MKTHTITTILALLTSASVAVAQSRQIPAPPQSTPVVIYDAHIHPVSSPDIERGYLVFEDGEITAIGSGRAPRTTGADRIDAQGLHVYPGLVSLGNRIGLEETGAVDVTHDHSELGGVTPEVRAAVAVNPDTDMIPVARANGILTALIFPRGGLLAGRASVLRLDGWTWEDLAIETDAGLVMGWPRMEPIRARWMNRGASEQRARAGEQLERIDQLFDDATAYFAARDHFEKVKPDLRYEAMRSALAGEKPIYIEAASASQIEAAVAWSLRRNVKIVLVSGTGATQVLPLLKQHDVPVIVRGVHRMPSGRHADYDEAFRVPKMLFDAGVRFAIASGESVAHERNLNHHAATAAAYGLPREAALKAVTLAAAEIAGVGERLGSLEKGKSATLIVTSGDPLEITTDTLIAFVDGRRLDLGTRQKSLYAKYQEKFRQLGVLAGSPESMTRDSGSSGGGDGAATPAGGQQ